MCTEILNGNRTVRAGLLALLTADTANLASCCHLFALVVGAAVYRHLLGVWNQLDQVSWTFCHALAAGFTCFLIHHCNAVHNMDCPKRTDLHAASEAAASIRTGLRTAVWHEGKHFAVFHTCVNILFLCLLTGSGTFHMGNLTAP